MHNTANPSNVRFGSLADISALVSDVRFAPESGHAQLLRQRPISAKGRLTARPRELASDGSVRQPLDMGAALAEFVLDALEAAIEMIDTADHGLPLRRKAGNDERHRGA